MGGVSLFVCSPHSKGSPISSSCSESPSPPIVPDFQTIRAKRGKNEFLFGGRWCFLGKIGDNRGRNLNIFLKSRKEGGVLRWSLAGSLACPLVAGGRALWGFRTCQTFGAGPLVVCSLLLSALSLCLCWVVLEICLYSRFKGVFSAVWGCCVGLCCLGALRGLWGFCVRE